MFFVRHFKKMELKCEIICQLKQNDFILIFVKTYKIDMPENPEKAKVKRIRSACPLFLF